MYAVMMPSDDCVEQTHWAAFAQWPGSKYTPTTSDYHGSRASRSVDGDITWPGRRCVIDAPAMSPASIYPGDLLALVVLYFETASVWLPP